MPTPTAINFPVPPDDLMVYPPDGTNYGDDLINACLNVPPGWGPEVVTQPQYGTVEFYDLGNSWSYNFTPCSNPPPGGTDSFTYRLVKKETSNTAVVTLTIAER